MDSRESKVKKSEKNESNKIPKWAKTILIAAAFFPCIVFAHPHSWVDMTTTIEGTENTITGLAMNWTFDAMTSAYALDGEDLSSENRVETMRKLADSMINNVSGSHYYTYFDENKIPIKFTLHQHGRLTQKKGKLTLSFDLRLDKPQKITSSSLNLRVFEPSFYVDMAWENETSITLSKALSQQCRVEIITPHPTAKQMAYAMSLPQDAAPDNALGQLFTQRAVVHCKVDMNPKGEVSE